jgi:hypothetical protein
VLESWEAYSQPHHPGLYAAMRYPGIRLSTEGLLDEAEELCRHSLDGRISLSGKMSIESIDSLSNLSLIKFGKEEYEVAENMQRQALAARETQFGLNHSIIPNSMSLLGNIV